MKPATPLLTIAAMAFVAQAAPLAISNQPATPAEETAHDLIHWIPGASSIPGVDWIPKALTVSGAGPLGLFLRRSHNARSIGGNEYEDILRTKREEA
ncbi:unnamed protein product [Tilletia laevis]|uniref:Uncharacterized protein n=3 Tax=Tilletia TaxID=13289 RepID=A0A8X7MU50_9BASI|nr:hypothetical protein CF336_g4827 [Tilletia laevis]KAE8195290.1 hypothetical protein CF328_g4485 [Tilletia controversa]KAE8261167.1 hypothetical protein A4X03_0g3487 [Tilletia caries]KAE8200006.1 hypothetical protein CF335_g4039 [Tilletia laevis]KAE8249049.1 hypothetical protein A4X06_0g3412 [Tilletia controversa]